MIRGFGRKLDAALYIEGKRVDNALVGFQAGSMVGNPSTAAIEVTPTNTIRHIVPRTHIMVATTDPLSTESTKNVLFEGEVLGLGFSKQDDGRSIVLHCADVSNYWSHVKQYWFNLSQSGGNFLDQFIRMSTSGSSIIPTVKPLGIKAYSIKSLNLATGEENKFLDSVIALLDNIGNISPFYLNARRRLRISDRVIRKNAGKVENLFQFSFFSDWLEKLTEGRSGETTLLALVTMLLNIIYHEYTAILAPPFLKTDIIKRDSNGNPIRKDKAGKSSAKEVQTEEGWTVGSFAFKPHLYSIPPPSCNVLFPNMYDGVTYQRNFLDETTRMTLTPQVMNNASPFRFLRLKVFKRPVELDTYFGLITQTDGTLKKRPKNAKYGTGDGQSAYLQEFEFMTNEERIKGINMTSKGMAPAPAMLSIQNQGKKKKGGVPRYIHNVASYEYMMQKFSRRVLQISGVPNIRPIPGYPLLILDDSEANMSMIAYLRGITQSWTAKGGASTQFHLALPREVDEIDWNRPRINADTGKLDFIKQNGVDVFTFEKLFENANVPPIPDWFDDSFKTIGELTKLYASFFGKNVRSVEDTRLFPGISQRAKDMAAATGESADSLQKNYDANIPTTATNELLRPAIEKLLAEYRLNQQAGTELEFVNEYTKRSFTTIDQLFWFLGASSKNRDGNNKPISEDTDYIGDITLAKYGVEEDGVLSDATYPVFDGRPSPLDFEQDIYDQSVVAAKKAGVKANTGKRKKTPTAAENAPTGLNVEAQAVQPLSYPIAEAQILKMRRAVINKYRMELQESRAFKG